jgi:branched-chain amino acid transport system permease protein
MDLLNAILLKPFADMAAAPDFLLQVLWEGLVAGVLYALIALGFVLIYKSSRIFNFAQGIMVVFAALTLIGFHEQFSAAGFSGHAACLRRPDPDRRW